MTDMFTPAQYRRAIWRAIKGEQQRTGGIIAELDGDETHCRIIAGWTEDYLYAEGTPKELYELLAGHPEQFKVWLEELIARPDLAAKYLAPPLPAASPSPE